ncbi:TIGR04076 family protein [Phytoactinopolyspora mesophila]|uniref:TIGR04076 family protein n=1 Tax=Phytoactinopolyspora mesophila TaxID=2650750 RepID=A0A7K3M0E2_9ACTN|nr:TIGR04076 family protein [Phytoactinopolyspora mesophila]NDL56720.1 TIGR04076 family protein [Phytoactinopolyspora mesophila]
MSSDDAPFQLCDLRVVVDRVEGRSVCGLRAGDYFDVTNSSQVSTAPGRHFCLYAMAAVLPLLPAKQRSREPNDWLATDNEVACPDPEERLIMRIERGEPRHLDASELT